MFFLLARRKFVLLATLMVALLGVFASWRMPISLYPMIEKPAVRATIYYVDDPYTFYAQWGQKIERSMKAVDGVEYVEATYQPDSVRIYAHFGWGADAQTAKQKIEAATSYFQSQLPSYLPPIRVDFHDPSTESYVAIRSDRYQPGQLSDMIDSELLPQINAIPGVAATWVSRKAERKLVVRLRAHDLIQYDVTADRIVDQLRGTEFDAHLGNLKTGASGEVAVYLNQGFDSVAALREMRVSSNDGLALRLSQVADVEIVMDQSGRFFQYGDEDVVAVAAWAEPSTNLYAVSGAFVDTVAKFAKGKGELFVLNSPRKFIEESLKAMLQSIALGLGVAALVVLLFYRKGRDVALICISMPTSLAISLLWVDLSGIGLNLLSLGAMGISIGMVVDGAVLAMDRLRQLETAHPDPGATEVAAAMRELVPTMLSSAISTLIVFMPLAFTLPMVSVLLRDMALVTSMIMVCSLFVNVVFVPVMFLMIRRFRRSSSVAAHSASVDGPRWLRIWMVRLLLRPRVGAALLAATLTMSVLAIAWFGPNIRREIIAQPKATIIDVGVQFKRDGLDDAEKVAIVERHRKRIRERFDAEVNYLYTDFRPAEAYISVHLKSYRQFDKVFAQIPDVVRADDDAEVTFEPWITSALQVEERPGTRVLFTARDEALNRRMSEAAREFLEKDARVRQVKISPRNRQIETYRVQLRETAADLALADGDYFDGRKRLFDFIGYSIEPQDLYRVRVGGHEMPLQVGIARPLADPATLNAVPVSVDGIALALQDIAHFEKTMSWREYYTRDARLMFAADLWYAPGVDAAQQRAVVAAMEAHLRKTLALKNVPHVVDDTSHEVRAALKSLFMAFALSLALVLLVVLLQFSSIGQALMVMVAVPLGVAGAVLALYLFDSTLSINSMLGMLMIVGLSVNNSIIIIDGVNIARSGREAEFARLPALAELIADVVSHRFKPLLVTNLTTVFCMLPLAIGFGAGQDILKPLGVSVAFGLTLSTALTAIVVPVLLSVQTWRMRSDAS